VCSYLSIVTHGNIYIVLFLRKNMKKLEDALEQGKERLRQVSNSDNFPLEYMRVMTDLVNSNLDNHYSDTELAEARLKDPSAWSTGQLSALYSFAALEYVKNEGNLDGPVMSALEIFCKTTEDYIQKSSGTGRVQHGWREGNHGEVLRAQLRPIVYEGVDSEAQDLEISERMVDVAKKNFNPGESFIERYCVLQDIHQEAAYQASQTPKIVRERLNDILTSFHKLDKGIDNHNRGKIEENLPGWGRAANVAIYGACAPSLDQLSPKDYPLFPHFEDLSGFRKVINEIPGVEETIGEYVSLADDIERGEKVDEDSKDFIEMIVPESTTGWTQAYHFR